MIGDNFMWFPSKSGPRVEGETTDGFFSKRKAFEVFSFTFNMDNKDPLDDDSGQGSVAGKAKFQEFSIDKKVDSASMPLYKACSLGTLFPTVMLASRRAAGQGSMLYLQFIFRYVRVTGITWSGGSGDDIAKETITFSFKALGAQYIPQTATGSAGTSRSWSWNTVTQSDKSGSPSLEITGIEGAPEFLPAFPLS